MIIYNDRQILLRKPNVKYKVTMYSMLILNENLWVENKTAVKVNRDFLAIYNVMR